MQTLKLKDQLKKKNKRSIERMDITLETFRRITTLEKKNSPSSWPKKRKIGENN